VARSANPAVPNWNGRPEGMGVLGIDQISGISGLEGKATITHSDAASLAVATGTPD
jgi:hypothetical protein